MISRSDTPGRSRPGGYARISPWRRLLKRRRRSLSYSAAPSLMLSSTVCIMSRVRSASARAASAACRRAVGDVASGADQPAGAAARAAQRDAVLARPAPLAGVGAVAHLAFEPRRRALQVGDEGPAVARPVLRVHAVGPVFRRPQLLGREAEDRPQVRREPDGASLQVPVIGTGIHRFEHSRVALVLDGMRVQGLAARGAARPGRAGVPRATARGRGASCCHWRLRGRIVTCPMFRRYIAPGPDLYRLYRLPPVCPLSRGSRLARYQRYQIGGCTIPRRNAANV